MTKYIDEYDLFVFDLDDTIVKTEKYHYEAWLKTLRLLINYSFFISYEEYCCIFHSINQDSIYNYIVNQLKLKNFNDIRTIKQDIYMKLLNRHKYDIELLEGISLFIQEIISKNKLFIIVTNSSKETLDFFVKLFPILNNSNANYTNEMFTKKKPSSECYELVRRDYNEKRIIGFEDSITGIHAITNVDSIDTIFINKKSYYHYDNIINNYRVKNTIINYLELLE